MMRLILASASPRRRELLQQAGLEFILLPSNCEELSIQEAPAALVEDLARQKGENVAEQVKERIAQGRFPQGEVPVILSADTVVSLDGNILGKPGDRDDAFAMLQSLQGRRHQVYTGVALICLSPESGEQIRTSIFHVETQVDVFDMTEREILDYIATGEPMDKAGAYGIQGRFAVYIKGIQGDYYNVVGLPISRVVRELREFC